MPVVTLRSRRSRRVPSEEAPSRRLRVRPRRSEEPPSGGDESDDAAEPDEGAEEAVASQDSDASDAFEERSTRASRARRGRGRPRKTRRVETPPTPPSEEAEASPAPSAGDGGDTVEVDEREYAVQGDELLLDADEAGDRKVDPQGRLQGGRTYRVPTFASPFRDDPERLYMLAIDVARVAGFRDSAYFFRKHPLLLKLFLGAEEKDHLIDTGHLNAQLRPRNVCIITAHNTFKVLGARVVTRGRHVVDDYYEAAARAEGRREGALVSAPSIEEIMRAERRRDSDRERERGRRRADAATYTTVDPQGETVTTTFGDAGHAPFERAGQWAHRRHMLQRADMTEENWMAEFAQSVRAMNSEIGASRRERLIVLPTASSSGASREPAAPAAGPAPRALRADAAAMVPDANDYAELDDRPPWERERALDDPGAAAARRRRRLAALRAAQPPLALYEPHTHVAHVPEPTQPTRAWVSKLSDVPALDERTRAVQGPARVGPRAWALYTEQVDVGLD